MQKFAEKTAVVTGAASGIGLALARMFAREGMNLVLADVEGPALDIAAATIPGSLAVRCDVSSASEVENLSLRAHERFGTVHILCNNAGVVGGFGESWSIRDEDWAWVLNVNLWGVIHGIRAFVPRMLAHQQEAHIVNTASLAGIVPVPFAAAYGVSKRAVIALSEALALELQKRGASIGVSVLCPAAVATNIVDAARNRPAQYGGPARPGPAMETIRKSIDAGMSPDDVAEKTLAAIRENRFYVMTHPESGPLVQEYTEDLLEAKGPPRTHF